MRAAALAGRSGDADAPAVLRSKLLQVIRKTGRSNLAARLIDDHRERWGVRRGLNSTDDQTVERLLPELAYCLGSGEWQRLGARHPKVVLAYASTTMPTGPDKDEWWQGAAYGVVGALDHDAGQVASFGPPTWRTLLVALRNHRHPDVRHLAHDLTTSPEG